MVPFGKMRETSRRLWLAMRRAKPLDKNTMETPLKRCLTVFDLTLLGIGNMAGSGIYVLTGTVIRDKSGPSTFISYLLAGITAFLNALCYAELASRIPKAGSAYTYTYVAGGEFLAFVIGWSIILEYVLSVASVARGWSGTIDTMAHHAISNGTMRTFGGFPKSAEFLGDYPDFIGALIIILLGIVLTRGPKLSVHLNSVVTCLNLLVLVLATGIMLIYPQHTSNYSFAPAEHGGFFPYGFGGMVAGAGTCFYAFIGFDAITVSSEEAIDPKKSMPIATAVSVSVVTVLFILASLGVVLFIPWWTVDRVAAFTAALEARGIVWATYITGFGSVLGLSASLFTSMYALPRITYSMASDGLLPKWIGYVMPSTQVPIVALALFGSLAALLTFLCDIHTLADFLSIGTLIAYSIVCINVCILRYLHPQLFTIQVAGELDLSRRSSTLSNGINSGTQEDQINGERPSAIPTIPGVHAETLDSIGVSGDLRPSNANGFHSDAEIDDFYSIWPHSIGRLKSAFRHLPVLRNSTPGVAPLTALAIFVCCATGLAFLALVATEAVTAAKWWAILGLIVCLPLALASLFIMLIHEQNTAFDTFKVPFVPVIPCISIFLNLCLIVKLSPMTWLRFVIWLLIGFAIYFTYGWRNSVLIENYGEAGPLLREKGIDYVAEGLTFSSDGNVNAAFSPDTNQNESKD